MLKNSLVFAIVVLFIISPVAMAIGIDCNTNSIKINNDMDDFAFVHSDMDNYSNLNYYAKRLKKDKGNYNAIESKNLAINLKLPSRSVYDDSMTPAWPTQGYNGQHIGRSPFSTNNNKGIEKWRFRCCWADGSPVIGDDGIIYFGDDFCYFYAIYPNGTLKWRFRADNTIGSFGNSPAIGDDGTIYFADNYNHLYALNPNGTQKWKKSTSEIATSITLDEAIDILYFGAGNNLQARYSNNGTLRWIYPTDHVVQSSPAIDENGTIYFGSHDNYIYALYPNCTLKWKFKTDDWVHGSPSIGNDDVIYCGSDDDCFYALFLGNGTLKWKLNIGSAMRSSPSIDKSGNLYFGVWDGKIFCIAPNGTVRWIFDLPDVDSVWGPTAAISDDGTIYIGNGINYWYLGGGEIIALNSNGTLKWRRVLCDSTLESSPVIGKDGTVYICACNEGNNPDGTGHLHAFGPLDPNAPSAPTITGPMAGKAGVIYEYTFTSTSPLGNNIYYFIDWGDGNVENWNWIGPYTSGQMIKVNHTWNSQGTYTINARAKDNYNLWGPWGTLSVTMPSDLHISQSSSLQINQYSSNQFLLKMFQRMLLNAR